MSNWQDMVNRFKSATPDFDPYGGTGQTKPAATTGGGTTLPGPAPLPATPATDGGFMATQPTPTPKETPVEPTSWADNPLSRNFRSQAHADAYAGEGFNVHSLVNDEQVQSSGAVAGPGGFQSASSAGPYGYTPASYGAAQGTAERMTAAKVKVTDDMLVEERLGAIMQSPVGQIAQQIASEQMNSRGMMDSSMAMQAIVEGAMNAGFPIASQDAQAYYDMAIQNVQAENMAREANMVQANTMESLNVNARNAASMFNAGASNDAMRFGISNRIQDTQWRQEFKEKVRQFDTNLDWDMDKFAQEMGFKYTDLDFRDFWNLQNLTFDTWKAELDSDTQKYGYDTSLRAAETSAGATITAANIGLKEREMMIKSAESEGDKDREVTREGNEMRKEEFGWGQTLDKLGLAQWIGEFIPTQDGVDNFLDVTGALDMYDADERATISESFTEPVVPVDA